MLLHLVCYFTLYRQKHISRKLCKSKQFARILASAALTRREKKDDSFLDNSTPMVNFMALKSLQFSWCVMPCKWEVFFALLTRDGFFYIYTRSVHVLHFYRNSKVLNHISVIFSCPCITLFGSSEIIYKRAKVLTFLIAF